MVRFSDVVTLVESANPVNDVNLRQASVIATAENWRLAELASASRKHAQRFFRAAVARRDQLLTEGVF